MIIDSNNINGDIINIHLDPVAIDSGPCYLVNVRRAGDGSPSPEELNGLLPGAVRPDAHIQSLDELIAYVHHLLDLDEWHHPLLLMPSDYGFQEISEPTDPFTAGAVAFARGLPFSANPYRQNEDNFDIWDQGWLAAREEVSGAGGNSSIT